NVSAAALQRFSAPSNTQNSLVPFAQYRLAYFSIRSEPHLGRTITARRLCSEKINRPFSFSTRTHSARHLCRVVLGTRCPRTLNAMTMQSKEASENSLRSE